MTQTRIEAAEKPEQCPVCGQEPVATILYGMSGQLPALQQQINEGSLVLGGCCMSDGDPTWKCTHCGQQIYWKTS